MKLTPREDMDRVQALDVQLGNLWNFTEKNPVFLKDGQLVADCQSGAPARIKIDSLGNPIDLPVEIKIGFHTQGIVLDAPGSARASARRDRPLNLPPRTRRPNECLQLFFGGRP